VEHIIISLLYISYTEVEHIIISLLYISYTEVEHIIISLLWHVSPKEVAVAGVNSL
jgi:hypothetical protein